MFDSFNNCLIVVRYGFNLVFVVRTVLDVRLNWLYDVKKVQRHPVVDNLAIANCTDPSCIIIA